VSTTSRGKPAAAEIGDGGVPRRRAKGRSPGASRLCEDEQPNADRWAVGSGPARGSTEDGAAAAVGPSRKALKARCRPSGPQTDETGMSGAADRSARAHRVWNPLGWSE
jgi:hypothetical protein